ncbi:unnamed protein product [Sympodiomycopsis kandeliae]
MSGHTTTESAASDALADQVATVEIDANTQTSSAASTLEKSEGSSKTDSKPKKAPHRKDPRSQSPSTQISKSLAYFLRHGAEKEKLPIRSDGYILVDEILKKQRMKQIKLEDGPNPNKKRSPTLQDIKDVIENPGDKKRFELMIDDEKVYVRAVQGHSIQSVTALDHVPITLDNLKVLSYQTENIEATDQASSSGLPTGVEILHGTVPDAWEKIKQSGGLSKMKRNHIHLARGRPGVEGVGSGMRVSSPLLLHIDLIKALQDGIAFDLANNGAVLTAGIDGILPLKYITKVEDRKGSIVWQSDSL